MQPAGRGRVQAAGGLIEKQDPRIVKQRPGDGQPLPHPGGIVLKRLGGGLNQLHSLQGGVDLLANIFETVQRTKKLQILAPGQTPVKAALISGDQPDGGFDRTRVVQTRPRNHRRTRSRSDQRGQHFDQGGFSSSVGAQQPKQLALGHGKGYPVHCSGCELRRRQQPQPALLARIALGELIDLDRWRGRNHVVILLDFREFGVIAQKHRGLRST